MPPPFLFYLYLTPKPKKNKKDFVNNRESKESIMNLPLTRENLCDLAPLSKSKACERRRWRKQRAGFGAAVEKIEDQRKPEDFFGHRKSYGVGVSRRMRGCPARCGCMA